MEGKFYMGIDPGKNGAVCVLDSNGAIVQLDKMPETPHELIENIESWTSTAWHPGNSLMCVLEKVGAHRGNAPQAMFNFGRNYGNIEAILISNRVSFQEVTPQKWQQHFQLGHKKDHDSDTAWKSHLWQSAKKLYPEAKIQKYAADAVLIARYCWERYR